MDGHLRHTLLRRLRRVHLIKIRKCYEFTAFIPRVISVVGKFWLYDEGSCPAVRFVDSVTTAALASPWLGAAAGRVVS